jgi:hypothetical protein
MYADHENRAGQWSFSRQGTDGVTRVFTCWSESRGYHARWYYLVDDEPAEYDAGPVEHAEIDADLSADPVIRAWVERRIGEHFDERQAAAVSTIEVGSHLAWRRP